jgi:hypothetical protein
MFHEFVCCTLKRREQGRTNNGGERMTARKPHFFNVSHCFDIGKLMGEMSQLPSTGAMGKDVVAFAVRHHMPLDMIVEC